MFLYHQWISLNINTRHKLAAHFGILKRGSTEVVDNVVKNDGYNIKEIEEKLNVDAIQNYLTSQQTDMSKLWVMLVNKIEGREYVDDVQPPVQEPKLIARIEKITIEEAKDKYGKPKNKGGRPRKIQLNA